jgi:8-oxo-dGTP diphosphatase
MAQRIIRKVGLAVFQNQQVLMVKTDFGKDAYYFLGGTVEANETDIECLEREVKEEANTTVVNETVTFLGEFTATAHGRENTLVTMRLYGGKLISEPQPSSEVTGIVYCDSTLDDSHQTPLSQIVFPWLRIGDLLNRL